MTIKLVWIKIWNLIHYLVSQIFILIISLQKRAILPGTLLIIRLDLLGDFFLYRGFLQTLKKSPKYHDNKITFCCNSNWKELAETYNGNSVDKFLYLDRNKFRIYILYRFRLLKQIYSAGYETVINLTYSREIQFGDLLVQASGATHRIGCLSDLEKRAQWKRRLFSNNYYTQLVELNEGNIFEIYRNKEFFEKILDIQITEEELIPLFRLAKTIIPEKIPYVVLVPGASTATKRWDVRNFRVIVSYILEHSDMHLILTGSDTEKSIAESLAEGLSSERIKNLAGRLSLGSLVDVISRAAFIISNETGTIHIAAAAGTPFICISSGICFGRFHPYPKEIFDKGYYIYPPEMMDRISNYDFLAEKYRFGSDLDINSIKPETVTGLVKLLLAGSQD